MKKATVILGSTKPTLKSNINWNKITPENGEWEKQKPKKAIGKTK